jgi:hypothetical protein
MINAVFYKVTSLDLYSGVFRVSGNIIDINERKILLFCNLM